MGIRDGVPTLVEPSGVSSRSVDVARRTDDVLRKGQAMIPDREIPESPQVLRDALQYVMEIDETDRRTMIELLMSATPFIAHLTSLSDTEEPIRTALIRMQQAQDRLITELSLPSPNPIVVHGLRYGLLQAVSFFSYLQDASDSFPSPDPF